MQTRSFCYVDDLVTGLLSLMQSTSEITGPINLGNPSEITIKSLCEHIIKLTDSESKLNYLPLPQNDPIRRKPDISKAKKIFGWEPKIKLNDGLNWTIKYFKELDSRMLKNDRRIREKKYMRNTPFSELENKCE